MGSALRLHKERALKYIIPRKCRSCNRYFSRCPFRKPAYRNTGAIQVQVRYTMDPRPYYRPPGISFLTLGVELRRGFYPLWKLASYRLHELRVKKKTVDDTSAITVKSIPPADSTVHSQGPRGAFLLTGLNNL